MAAVMTTDSQVALWVISRTPKASATGDMALPAIVMDQPAKNHRNAGTRSGRPEARLVLDGRNAPLGDGPGFPSAGASGSDTTGDAASAMGNRANHFRNAVAADFRVG